MSERHLILFSVLPKLFYNANRCRLGPAFPYFQAFLAHGGEIIKREAALLTQIADMGVQQLKGDGEVECCEGALMLHSLLVGYGAILPTDTITRLTDAVEKRLKLEVKLPWVRYK